MNFINNFGGSTTRKIFIALVIAAVAIWGVAAIIPATSAHAQTTGTATAVPTTVTTNSGSNALSGLGYYAVLNSLFGNNNSGLYGNGYGLGNGTNGIGNLGAYWAAATLFNSPSGVSGANTGYSGNSALSGLGYYAVLNSLFGNNNGLYNNGTVTTVNQSVVTSCPTSVMAIGSTGTQVTALQQLLNAMGFAVGADGQAGAPGNETTFYGQATANAVARFQNARGLAVTGTVNTQTLAALQSACSGGTSGTNSGIGNLGSYWAAATLFNNPSGAYGSTGGNALSGLGYYAVLNSLFGNNGMSGNGLGYGNSGIGNLGAYWAAATLFNSPSVNGVSVPVPTSYGTTGAGNTTTGATGTNGSTGY